MVIVQEATAGYEQADTIILQGHMDMVCEKENGCAIDFEKDGLDLYVDGDFLKARGTTLGGDDGIAVAYALAIMDSPEIAHPRLEVVITVDEEIGMLGAEVIDLSMLKGHKLLNIDSDVEGHFLTSCAGGMTVETTIPVDRMSQNGFCTLHPEEDTIMLAKWPEYKAEWNFAAEEEMVEHCKDLVKGVRNLRTEMDVPPSRKAKIFIVSDDAKIRDTFEANKEVYVNLAGASEIAVQADKTGIEEDAVSVVIPGATLYLPLEDLVDFEKEKERLLKEQARLEKELARSKGMLSNEKFLSKAPEAKVQEEKEKLAGYEQMMAQVKERLAQMK